MSRHDDRAWALDADRSRRLAEFERELIRARTGEGRECAKAHAVDELPEAFRTVVVTQPIEGMSVEETAELFGILTETVKTRLHRARRMLRVEMEKHIGPVLGNAFPFFGRRCEGVADRALARLGLN
jgi:DNA-directed RNA polymerase specialized sigma24 family protein